MTPQEIRALIFERIAEIAGVPSSTLADDSTLESVGLDSADAVVLAMEVEQVLKTQIDVALFLRCATIAEAASEIAKVAELSDA